MGGFPMKTCGLKWNRRLFRIKIREFSITNKDGILSRTRWTPEEEDGGGNKSTLGAEYTHWTQIFTNPGVGAKRPHALSFVSTPLVKGFKEKIK